jgi:hypothetical protein
MVPTWTGYQTARPTPARMRAFHFERRTGFGMIAGPASARHAAWDFDCPDTYRDFVAAAEASGLGELVRLIESGYCDETPAGGRRWIVHYPEGIAWRDETLARRPGGEGEPTIKTLIELPTFAILAPSHGPTHPSGRPYVRLFGGFETIPAVTAEEHTDLRVLARTFDAMPHSQPGDTRTAQQSGNRPGDAFNRRASWPKILEPAGWRHVCDRAEASYWCRPGKTHGVSATTNLGDHDRLYVFTSSTPFEPEKSYSKFAAYAVLNHGGDFTAAARHVTAEGCASRLVATSAGDTMNDPDSGRAPIHARPVLVRLQDVQPEPVTWLWPGRLAAGKLALLVGDPGLGKSWITLDLAARLSTGRAMPDDGPANPPGNVILLSAEDGVADTIRPRLDALGADVARIHHLAVLQAGEHERAVQLADTAALEWAIRETDARLMVIDPIAAYLGSTDAHRDAEVRGLMAPLAALAERTNAAILGLMHLAKSTQRPAIYRAVGSIAFAAAARVVLAVAADPERDDRRIMAAIKSNLAAAPAALAYTLSEGKLVWAAEPVSQVDVDALLSGPVLDRQERRAADEWLRDLLAEGPALVRDLQAGARSAGLVWRTIERAKTRLGVRATLLGYGSGGRWQWRLPETDSGADHASETVTMCAVSVSDAGTNKTGPYDQRPTLPLELSVSEDLSVSELGSTEKGDVRRERVRF